MYIPALGLRVLAMPPSSSDIKQSSNVVEVLLSVEDEVEINNK